MRLVIRKKTPVALAGEATHKARVCKAWIEAVGRFMMTRILRIEHCAAVVYRQRLAAQNKPRDDVNAPAKVAPHLAHPMFFSAIGQIMEDVNGLGVLNNFAQNSVDQKHASSFQFQGDEVPDQRWLPRQRQTNQSAKSKARVAADKFLIGYPVHLSYEIPRDRRLENEYMTLPIDLAPEVWIDDTIEAFCVWANFEHVHAQLRRALGWEQRYLRLPPMPKLFIKAGAGDDASPAVPRQGRGGMMALTGKGDAASIPSQASPLGSEQAGASQGGVTEWAIDTGASTRLTTHVLPTDPPIPDAISATDGMPPTVVTPTPLDMTNTPIDWAEPVRGGPNYVVYRGPRRALTVASSQDISESDGAQLPRVSTEGISTDAESQAVARKKLSQVDENAEMLNEPEFERHHEHFINTMLLSDDPWPLIDAV